MPLKFDFFWTRKKKRRKDIYIEEIKLYLFVSIFLSASFVSLSEMHLHHNKEITGISILFIFFFYFFFGTVTITRFGKGGEPEDKVLLSA